MSYLQPTLPLLGKVSLAVNIKPGSSNSSIGAETTLTALYLFSVAVWYSSLQALKKPVSYMGPTWPQFAVHPEYLCLAALNTWVFKCLEQVLILKKIMMCLKIGKRSYLDETS